MRLVSKPHNGDNVHVQEILTLISLAAYLQLAESEALKLLREGDIKAKQIDGQWRILRKNVDAYLDS